MSKIRSTLWALVMVLQATAQSGKIPVFVAGADGYKSYRIPAIIRLQNGELLAFCEGRVNGFNDFGNVDIVMKRSSDKGRTWSPLQKIVDNGDLQAGNSAPVVDLTDPNYPKGRVFLFYNTGNVPESEVRKGHGLREVWYRTSVDNGVTWSESVNITLQVHRPRQPGLNPGYNFPEDWRSYANTPGHALQIREGKFKGRIFVAANHSAGEPQPGYADGWAHGYYTDDHGRTFHLGASVNFPGSNESMAAELSHDRLMMNSRCQRGDIRARIVSVSSDGGATWDTSYVDPTLIDPVNQGSILTVGKEKGKAIIAFCNAANTKRRDDLTLQISFDDGRTWAKKYPVDKSPDDRGDFTAYSDLVKLGKREIGVLYERDNYKEIAFTVVGW
jgi:sialidase-1